MSMSEATLVGKAKFWAEELCEGEKRGRTDFVNAIERVAATLRMPFGFLRHLIYDQEPPKTISAGRFFKLAAAYDECLQRRKYREERAAFEPNTPLGRALARAADLAAGEGAESLNE